MKRNTKKVKLPDKRCKDSGKFIHPTPESAEVHLKSLLNKHKAKKHTIHVYECPHCCGWHVGHYANHDFDVC